MDYNSTCMFLENESISALDESAIYYGFKSRDTYLEALTDFSTLEDLENDNYHNENFELYCLNNKKEYYEIFDVALKGFYKNNNEKNILRLVDFYSTSRAFASNQYVQIHDKKRLKKYSNAKDTISELFNSVNLSDEEQESALRIIQLSIDKVNISIQDIKNLYTKKIDDALSQLKVSTYRKKEILDILKTPFLDS